MNRYGVKHDEAAGDAPAFFDGSSIVEQMKQDCAGKQNVAGSIRERQPGRIAYEKGSRRIVMAARSRHAEGIITPDIPDMRWQHLREDFGVPAASTADFDDEGIIHASRLDGVGESHEILPVFSRTHLLENRCECVPLALRKAGASPAFKYCLR